MRILVTGGLGFIGSNLIRYLLASRPADSVVNFDAETYAGNRDNLVDINDHPRYRFVLGDILDREKVALSMHGCDAVIHLAAETHVDRSIHDSGQFVKTNVLGTQTLLETARSLGVKKFVHVSTDEVYGSKETGYSREDDVLAPRSPYAASKAASDMLVRSYHVTYGLNVVIGRCSNNFGPYQFPEKAIPLMISNVLEGKPYPLYGDGLQVRDWLYVLDHVRALQILLERGAPGEVYNIGGAYSCANIDLTKRIFKILCASESLIQRVADRPGHDRRYALNCGKISELGWKPVYRFDEALLQTVNWYKENASWWRNVKSRTRYQEYYSKQYAPRVAVTAD